MYKTIICAHVHRIRPNRHSPPAILLRESYRDAGKVRKRTLANLSKWPTPLVGSREGCPVAVEVFEGNTADPRTVGVHIDKLRRIAGCVSHVFDTEPLPAESPLWAMPNVLITPHSPTTSTAGPAGSRRCSRTTWSAGGPASRC